MVVYSLSVVAPIVCGGLVLGTCFILQYFVLFLRWGRKSWLLYFCCVLNVMVLPSFSNSFSRSVVCYCGNCWSYPFTFSWSSGFCTLPAYLLSLMMLIDDSEKRQRQKTDSTAVFTASSPLKSGDLMIKPFNKKAYIRTLGDVENLLKRLIRILNDLAEKFMV